VAFKSIGSINFTTEQVIFFFKKKFLKKKPKVLKSTQIKYLFIYILKY